MTTLHATTAPTTMATPAMPDAVYKEHAHAGAGKCGNTPHYSTDTKQNQKVEWKEGVKIDTIVHAYYFDPIVYLNSEHHQPVLENVEDALHLSTDSITDFGISFYSSKAEENSQIYHYRKFIKYAGVVIGRLCLRPYTGMESRPYILLTLQLAEIHRLGAEAAVQQLIHTLLPPGLVGYAHGSLASIHFAVDVAVPQTTFVTTCKGVRRITRFEEDGVFTDYYGAQRSSVLFCLYNKLEQLLKRKPPVAIAHDAMTRLEVRLRGGSFHSQLWGLAKLKNPWQRLGVYPAAALVAALPLLNNPATMAKVQTEGLMPYVRSLSTHHRAKAMKALAAVSAPEWYNAEAVWQACLAAAHGDMLARPFNGDSL